MGRFGSILRLVLCASLLLIALSVPSSSPTQAAGPASGLDVTVTNTPLSVTGSTTVSGTVTVTQSGTWNVGITPSSNAVQVSNPTSNPVPVRNVDSVVREPFQAEVGGGFNGSSGIATVVTVPDGKRLVVEHVSAHVNATNDVGLSSSGIGVPFSGPFDSIVCSPAASDAFNHIFQCSVQTKFYADSGQEVDFFAQTLGDPGAGSNFAAFVSGYYVPTQ